MLEKIINNLLGNQVSKIAQKYNIDPEQVRSISSIVLPLIVKSISNKTKTPASADQLMQAASQHNETTIDDVDTNDGMKILGHLFGDAEAVSNKVAERTNTSKENTNKIMSTIAPLVMSYINQQQKSGTTDSTNINKQIEDNKGTRDKDGVVMQMATKMLDSNNDGNISDDLIKKGMNLFFGDKK